MHNLGIATSCAVTLGIEYITVICADGVPMVTLKK